MTNFQVIKQMTVEELGKFLNHVDCANCTYHESDGEGTGGCSGHKHCKDGITKWLGQESDWWMSDYIKENNL